MKQIIGMDSDWRFFKGDLEPAGDVSGWGGAKAKAFGFGATDKDFDDSGWRTVNIPHDFVVEGDYIKRQEIFPVTVKFLLWRLLITGMYREAHWKVVSDGIVKNLLFRRSMKGKEYIYTLREFSGIVLFF